MSMENKTRVHVRIILRGGSSLWYKMPRDAVNDLVNKIKSWSEVGGHVQLNYDADGNLSSGFLFRDVVGFQIQEQPPEQHSVNVGLFEMYLKEAIKQLKEGDNWKEGE